MKKLLLIGFMLAGIFITYSLSSIYASLDGGGNLIQIDMSGHYFAVRRYDCYKRLFQFFVRKTARLEQRTLGRGFGPSDKIITTKFHISSIGRKMRPPPKTPAAVNYKQKTLPVNNRGGEHFMRA